MYAYLLNAIDYGHICQCSWGRMENLWIGRAFEHYRSYSCSLLYRALCNVVELNQSSGNDDWKVHEKKRLTVKLWRQMHGRAFQPHAAATGNARSWSETLYASLVVYRLQTVEQCSISDAKSRLDTIKAVPCSAVYKTLTSWLTAIPL